MERKEKDPQMRLVQLLVHIPVWQKQELEALGINASELIRQYLDQRLQKTKEIELAVDVQIRKYSGSTDQA